MPQIVKPSTSKKRVLVWAQRSLGIIVLLILVLTLDLEQVYQIIANADILLVVLAILAVIPLILVKTIRWKAILSSQGVQIQLSHAFLAYFASLFIGYLTPGRLGEFVRAMYVSRDCGAPSAKAFSSVLADRLFDLYALLIVGGAALLTLLAHDTGVLIELVVSSILLALPLFLFLNSTSFGWLSTVGLRLGSLGHRLFAPGSWLHEMRAALRQMTVVVFLVSIVLTAVAYAIFFGQCYLFAVSLGLPANFAQISYAIALGSLVALLPISISGLGTREAVIIARLGLAGVPTTAALGFSLLVFATFYIAGGLMGALAWMIKPVPLGDSLSAPPNR
jgi:uncharacterized protein (TIRG00374 family)